VVPLDCQIGSPSPASVEAGDGERFVPSHGRVFPEEQKNAHDMIASLTGAPARSMEGT
jgi:hypothetical protein